MDDSTLKKVLIFIFAIIGIIIFVPPFLIALVEAIGAFSSEYIPYGSNRLCFAVAAFFRHFWDYVQFPALFVASILTAYYLTRALYHWEGTAKFLNMDNSMHNSLGLDTEDPGNFIDYHVKSRVLSVLICVIFFLSFAFYFFVVNMPLTDFFDSMNYKVCSR